MPSAADIVQNNTVTSDISIKTGGSLTASETGIRAEIDVNFFSPSASTSLFAKLDVTFGEETNGIGAKAGARVSW